MKAGLITDFSPVTPWISSLKLFLVNSQQAYNDMLFFLKYSSNLDSSNLVSNDSAHRLITNGLRNSFTDSTGDVNYPVQMAAVALVSLPLFLVFIFLRKYIMKGVSRSGIKG